MKLASPLPLSLLSLLAAAGMLLALSPARGSQAATEPPPAPELDTRGDVHPHVRADRAGNLVFRNRHLVALVARHGDSFGPVYVYRARRPAEREQRLLAVLPSLAELRWQESGAERRGTFVPRAVRTAGGNRGIFTGTVGEGGARWETEAVLRIGNEPWLDWEVETRPAAAVGLLRFAPMAVRVGRAGPREAIFPGIAYVEGEEPLPGGPVRVPDAHRVTVPLMSLSQHQDTVALLWDQRQPWGGEGYPAALLGAPARGDHEGVHRMELFLPPVGRHVRENEETAAAALPVAAGHALRLAGKLLVLRDEEDPAHAVREWLRAYVEPRQAFYSRKTRQMASLPRDFDAERRLCREALTRTLWRSEAGGWVHAVGVPGMTPRPEPFNILALRMDAALTGGKTGQLLRTQADSVLAELRRRGAVEPRLAYRVGGVLSSLAAEKSQVAALLQTQLASGAWTLEPSAGQDRSLAEPGQVELGVVTDRVLPVLRHAALTGDTSAAGAGIRALEFIERQYRVPRGAQPWEVPLRAPDLLAAAEATDAFVLGYEITGQSRYLESARYWADTGLPFVYLWDDPARPSLRGSALGSLAAGVPTQWVGLAYARALQHLHEVRPDDVYERVIDSILGSAMRQQSTTGEHAGLLPTTWNLREERGAGPWISPELLLAVLYHRQGLDTDPAYAVARVGPDRMFIGSGAAIVRAETTAARLRLGLRWLPGEDSYLTLDGVPDRPLRVEYNTERLRHLGVPLPRRFLPEVTSEREEGWFYDPESHVLILRLRHTGDEDRLEVRWPDSRERSPVRHSDTRVEKRR